MRKLQSYMIALFCTGVFAAGLGTGITFSEFSSFTYMGDADAGPVDMKTERLDYDMGRSHHSDEISDPESPEDTCLDIIRTDRLPESEEDIVADDSVPRGIIRFQVTYNAAAVRPYVEYSEGSYVGIGSYDISDDFERFMRNKDLFLKDLKARQLHSYKSAGITQIKVLVHPEDRDMLRLP